jgi:hypothetical protein
LEAAPTSTPHTSPGAGTSASSGCRSRAPSIRATFARTRRWTIAVYDSAQQWGNPDRGIQLFGTAHRAEVAEAEAAERVYAKRFPAFRGTDLGAYRFYAFLPRRLKLFDEESLGAGTFVSAKLEQGRLAWERTELYRPSA